MLGRREREVTGKKFKEEEGKRGGWEREEVGGSLSRQS